MFILKTFITHVLVVLFSNVWTTNNSWFLPYHNLKKFVFNQLPLSGRVKSWLQSFDWAGGVLKVDFDTITLDFDSIAYRKQIPPQRTVGIIGSVWQESTPLRETTGPAQTRKTKRYENEQSEMPNSARAALAWARGL